MIDGNTKSKAIAQLRRRVPIDQIATDLNIPPKLVEQWQANLDPEDLVAIQANIYAVETLMNDGGILVGEDEEREAKLRRTLEETALDIAKQSVIPAMTGDMVHAKAVQLCADAVTKLYQTLVLKGATGVPDTGRKAIGSPSMFQELMKD